MAVDCKTVFYKTEHFLIESKGEIRMEPALQQDLGATERFCLLQLPGQFFPGQHIT